MGQTGQLQQLAENLWVVDGTIRMPPGPLPRRMSVARLGSGELVIFSAIALDEAGMNSIEALGRPTFLVVPNPFHREDAPAWKARYPEMRVVAPQRARTAVEEVLPVEDIVGDFGDESVQLVQVTGTKGESALVMRHAAGATLVVNDLIANVRDARGLMRIVLTLMGFAGKPQVPRMFKRLGIEDKGPVAAQFREWAAIPGLERIVVSHGAIITEQPAQLLTELAEKLAPRK